MFVYAQTPPLVEWDTRSTSKQNTAGLNSEFSFSETGCLTKAKELSLLYYLLIAGGEMIDSCLSHEH